MYKPKSSNTFKERVIYGFFMTALTIVGIPFTPFVPLVALFGGWKMDGMAEGYTSVLLTCLMGLIVYGALFAWIFH